MTARQSPSQEGDMEFLKDQVQRLSAVLSKYQRKYLPLSPEDEAESAIPSDAPHAPWLTNKQFLSPLLVEYDHMISELNQQISSYQTELASLTARVQEVTDENSKLHSDLRKSLESQLKSGGGSLSSGAVVEAVQEQMNLLSTERDSYIDLWRQASKELETLQRSDREKTESLHKCKTELVTVQQAATLAEQTIDELQGACQRLDEERGQCLSRAQEQAKELNSLGEELSQARAELKAANIKNTDLKRSLDEITLQLRRRETERKKTEDHEQSLDDRIHHLQVHSTDIEAKLLVSQREAALLKGEKSDLEEALSTAQSKVSALEQRECEAVIHVKESMQIAEDALTEKEQTLVREQQMSQEIARLKKALSTILHEAGERTRKEVDIVRGECNFSIDKMAEEIQKLEQECGQKQAQYERALRDKKGIEKELEKIVKAAPQETTQRGEVLHELQTRVCAAERARDELSLKLDTALTSIKSLQVKLIEEQQARRQLTQEHCSLQRKNQEEVEQLQEQKMKFIGAMKELQVKMQRSDQLREAVEMRLIKEKAELTQKYELINRELVSRLESSEDTRQRSVHELREMMAAQHRVGLRWREESKSLAQKFELSTSSLKAELIKHKQNSEQLTLQLHQMRLEKDNLTSLLRKMTDSNSALQQQLNEVEAQAESTHSQLKNLVTREKQLLQERRELQRQLDNVKVKMNRIGSLDRPQNIALSASNRMDPAHLATDYTPKQSYLTPTTHPPPQLESSQWNTALSELHRSIRQVRQDLGLRSGQGANDEELSLSMSYSQADLSDQLSREDLTHSHVSLVQS